MTIANCNETIAPERRDPLGSIGVLGQGFLGGLDVDERPIGVERYRLYAFGTEAHGHPLVLARSSVRPTLRFPGVGVFDPLPSADAQTPRASANS